MYKKAKKVLQLGIWCRISAWHQIVGLWFVFDQEFGDRFLHFPWDSIANKKTTYILKSRWSYNLNQMGFQVSKIGLRSISTIRYVIGLHGSASKAIALVIQRRKVLETKTRIRSNTQDQDIVAAAEITPCHVLCVPNMILSKSVFSLSIRTWEYRAVKAAKKTWAGSLGSATAMAVSCIFRSNVEKNKTEV